MHLNFLEALDEDWQPISKQALAAWLAFYGLFLVYALSRQKGESLFIDLVFVPIHEGGHALFGFFGYTLSVAGGTLLQLFVPLALAVYFFFQRQLPGTVFAGFFFFENFLSVGTYMADARRLELPLVSLGGSEDVQHDWTYLLGTAGLLQYDTAIGGFVRFLGWLGMLGTIAWFAWKGWTTRATPTPVIPSHGAVITDPRGPRVR